MSAGPAWGALPKVEVPKAQSKAKEGATKEYQGKKYVLKGDRWVAE